MIKSEDGTIITLFPEDMIESTANERKNTGRPFDFDLKLSDFKITTADISNAHIVRYNPNNDRIYYTRICKFIVLKDRFEDINLNDMYKVDYEKQWDELCKYAFDSNLIVDKSKFIICNNIIFLKTGEVHVRHDDTSTETTKIAGNRKFSYYDMRRMINTLICEEQNEKS